MRPRTSHGAQLQRLFCNSSFQPNCLGEQFAFELVLNYTSQFMKTYRASDTPWAAFAHFIDSHEDSYTAVAALDEPLQLFLNSEISDDTVVVVTSDHGLHYGSYFALNEGRRERAQPLLHIRLPHRMITHKSRIPPQNLGQPVTAFDVFKTLTQVLGVAKRSSSKAAGPFGRSSSK